MQLTQAKGLQVILQLPAPAAAAVPAHFLLGMPSEAPRQTRHTRPTLTDAIALSSMHNPPWETSAS